MKITYSPPVFIRLNDFVNWITPQIFNGGKLPGYFITFLGITVFFPSH